MPLSVLNNIPGLSAQNQLTITNSALQKTLYRLSSGSRINSGADDAAGLSIANGLGANISALTQSVKNASDGIGLLQTADGALSQVTSLLNRAVTLATEAANGSVSGTTSTGQLTAIDNEYQKIQAEINRIGTKTTFNGMSIFSSGGATVTNPNQWTSGMKAGTDLSTADSGKTLTIVDSKTQTSKTYTVTAGMTGQDLVDAINADAGTGANQLDVKAGFDASGNVQITDSSNDGSLYITSDGSTSGAGLGTMAAATGTTPTSFSVYLSDGSGNTSDSGNSITTQIGALNATAALGTGLGLGLSSTMIGADDTTTQTNAQAELGKITKAIAAVAAARGAIGANINRLSAATNVINNQLENLSSAQDNITAADISTEVSNMTKYNVLTQTGISALSQSNQMQQALLKLLQ